MDKTICNVTSHESVKILCSENQSTFDISILEIYEGYLELNPSEKASRYRRAMNILINLKDRDLIE